MLPDVEGWGLACVLDVQSLSFLLMKIGFAPWPDIMMSQTLCIIDKNLPFDSDVRQRSHTWIIPLHCLWAKSNNRTRGQFECDVNWFCFCFDFVRSQARCDCCFIVYLRFQVVEIRLIAKWVLKMWIIINERYSWYF